MKYELEALEDAVIVKPLEEQQETYGAIIVPDAGKDRNVHAEIIAVGPGYYTATGELIKSVLKVGDKVILPTMGFTKLEHDGEEFYIGKTREVLGRLNNVKENE